MERSQSWRSLSGVIVVALAGMLTGCDGFFVPVNGSGSGGSGAGTGNYVYVGNAQTNSVSGFQVGTGVLTNLPNMPYDLGFSPAAMVVHPSNKFLYVAGVSSIFMYSIGSNGALERGGCGGRGRSCECEFHRYIARDGNWLFALDVTQQIRDERTRSIRRLGALTAC